MRLAINSERGLATMRIKAFRHVHDLPVLTQSTERRGALVSRVTSDVDTVSQFLQFGGFIFLVSIGQMLLATVVMFVYSWQLALVVLVCFIPLFASLKYLQRAMSAAYGVVRAKVGEMLSAIAEPVVGAQVVRAYAIERRTQDRIDASIEDYRRTATRAQALTGLTFSIGGLAAGPGERRRAVGRRAARASTSRRRWGRSSRSCSWSRCSRTRCRSRPRC